MQNIVIYSTHYPHDTPFSLLTKKTLIEYCSIHGYDYFFDCSEPTEKDTCSLYFRRCEILPKVAEKYPNADWFVWVDSDVYVRNNHLRIESLIDLSDENILYHLFHEKPCGKSEINTGVKFISKHAVKYECLLYKAKDTEPYNKFPYDQDALYELVLPMIKDRYIIHDPYKLNCMIGFYPKHVNDCLFAHMCSMSEQNRLNHMKIFLSFRDKKKKT